MKVLILHFRSARTRAEGGRRARANVTDSAGTDGVSLEIMKRQALLEEMGHKVDICSAYDWADLPIPALEFDREDVAMMIRNLFGHGLTDFTSEAELEQGPREAARRGKLVSPFAEDIVVDRHTGQSEVCEQFGKTHRGHGMNGQR